MCFFRAVTIKEGNCSSVSKSPAQLPRQLLAIRAGSLNCRKADGGADGAFAEQIEQMR